MLQIFLCLLVFASAAFAQDKAQTDLFKKEVAPLQAAVEEAVNGSAAGGLFQHAKATYLDGYGVVVTVEGALEPGRNPFSGSSKTPAEVRSSVARRRAQIREKLEELLKQQSVMLKSVGQEESLTVVLYLVNSNPADVPDLPAQIVLSAKKQDPTHIIFREF